MNFHERDYNTWLDLNGFMIELQTGKETLEKYNKDAEGIVHFALYEENIERFVFNVKDMKNIKFKKKEGNYPDKNLNLFDNYLIYDIIWKNM